jgi:hypothetical protein
MKNRNKCDKDSMTVREFLAQFRMNPTISITTLKTI